MSTVPIIISGVFYPKGKTADDKPEPGTFVGNAAIYGLGVGGGPVYPPEGGGGGDKPPNRPVYPAFPITGPPGTEWPGVPGYPPWPGHPLPEPPEMPTDPDKPPPSLSNWDAKVAWTPVTGWIVVLVPGEGATVPTPSRRDR